MATTLSSQPIAALFDAGEQPPFVDCGPLKPFRSAPGLSVWADGREVWSRRQFRTEGINPVSTWGPFGDTLDALGRNVADYLVTLLRPGTVIGVSDGKTTAAVAHHVRRTELTGIEVVPLIGGVGGAQLPTDPYEVASSLAHGLGVASRPLPVPAAVDREETAAALMASPIVRAAFEVIARSSIALVGAGAISPNAACFDGNLLASAAIKPSLRRAPCRIPPGRPRSPLFFWSIADICPHCSELPLSARCGRKAYAVSGC